MVEVIDAAFPFLIFLVIGAILVGGCYAVYLRIKRNILGSFGILLGTIAFGSCIFALILIVQSAARKEVRAAVADTREGTRELMIDGVKIKDPEPYLRAFDKMKWFMVGHHSHPIPPTIEVSFVRKDDTVRLQLERDSDRKNEYWVYFPKYRTHQDNEVGRIYTGLFAK